MKTDSLNHQILAIAWPAIVTNITTPLMGLIDVAITGHLGSSVFLAAIALGGTLFNMVYWLLNFLRMGTSGITARAAGAGDDRQALLTLARALAIAGAMSLVILAASPLIGSLGLDLLDSDNATRHEAYRYFMVAVWGAPAVLGNYALAGWFIGMQDSRPVMYSALTTNIANIILSLLLVYVCRLGIIGVAAGTATAQWCGLAVAVGMARKKISRLNARLTTDGIMERSRLREFFGINRDIMLRTLCIIAVTTWFTRAGASQGSLVLAANALLMQFFMLFSFFIDGFAYAAEAISGSAVGSGDKPRLHRAIRALFLWSGALALVFSALYFCVGESILGILTDDAATIDTAREYMAWIVVVPLAGFAAFTWDGICIGMASTRLMLVSMAISAALFFAAYHLLTPALGNHALWLAFILYLSARGILQSILVRHS